MKNCKVERRLEKHFCWITNEKTGARAEIFNANLRKRHFARENFSGITIVNSNFEYSNLSNSNFKNAELTCNNFLLSNCEGADFENAALTYSDLSSTNFKSANFQHANLNETILVSTNFQNADLRNAKLERCNFYSVNFDGADLRNAKYVMASLLLNIEWRDLPGELTLELMRHDFEFSGVNENEELRRDMRFPYTERSRKFNFQENSKLWEPGLPKYRGMNLFKVLCEAKNIKI